MTETIFALSSGAAPSGVAVIRLSGPDVRFVLETMVGSVPEPRMAALRDIGDGQQGTIDRGLVFYFPGPRSFTGEDCAEFHLHGGRAVIARALEVLAGMRGLRMAERGEFSRRAFENGKLDLTEVEGLADLIRAETEFQRRAALDQAGGALRSLYESWMRRLVHARAMLEAEIDFADESDIPGSVSDVIWEDLEKLRGEIRAHLCGVRWGEIVRDGFRIALVGAPNAGKSTLLNRLADREVAIVSAVPGTTRDILEVRLDLGGHFVLLTDTAGLRESGDEIELEGMRRARQAMEAADLVIVLDDGSGEPPMIESSRAPVWSVRSKADISNAAQEDSRLAVSAVTGAGVERLIGAIKAEIEARQGERGAVSPNRERHRALLADCGAALDEAFGFRSFGRSELIAETLRRAGYSLGRITGQVDVEDLLGVIFSEFCVGK